jgi:pimeloyl-ACP methyl ester carboxylesterase
VVTKGAIQLDCEIPYTEARLPIWREILWGVEWLDLRASPIYRGVGVARGDGEPVVLVPGFLGSDAHLGELQRWLTRAGYRVVLSGIGRNADCPDVMLEIILETVEATYRAGGQRVRLIGHSLGGTLARAAGVFRPDLVAQVITLASPIREVSAHPLVLGLARVVGRAVSRPSQAPRRHGDHYHDGTCSCQVMDALIRPFPKEVARGAIYTAGDGVVDWRSCLDEDDSVNVEVKGTHLGLVVNKGAYLAVANFLAGVGSAAKA